jgi:hypothetical protein
MSELDLIMEKLEGLEQGIAALQDAMGLLLEAAAPKPKREPPPPAAPTPIASYEQMYGPIVAADALQESGVDATRAASLDTVPPGRVPRSRLRRWLTKEEGP